MLARCAQCPEDRVQRDLKLAQHYLGPGDIRSKAGDPVDGQMQVGPRGYGNLIAPGRVHHNDGSTRMAPSNGSKPIDANPLRSHALPELLAKCIIAHTPDKAHLSPEPTCCDGLI